MGLTPVDTAAHEFELTPLAEPAPEPEPPAHGFADRLLELFVHVEQEAEDLALILPPPI